MKASSWGPLAPCRGACAVRATGPAVRKTTPLADDGDLLSLALWNGCATSPIFNAADAIMCNQGSPSWSRAFAVEEEEEETRSAGEESNLWTLGKPANVSVYLEGLKEDATMPIHSP